MKTPVFKLQQIHFFKVCNISEIKDTKIFFLQTIAFKKRKQYSKVMFTQTSTYTQGFEQDIK